MKLLTLLKNKKFRIVISVFTVILVVPQVVFASGWLDFGVMIMSLFARITGWAGIMLNMAILELVFGMGDKITNNFGASLEDAWGVIRDMMNLLFIFSLIYIGFLVILDASSSHARRLLPPLIIAALLVNFSLFFTKFIVDVSNIAAVEIYKTVGFGKTAATDPEGQVLIGVSGAFMQVMGLKDLISPQQSSTRDSSLSYGTMLEKSCDKEDKTSCSTTVIVYFLLSMIFFLVAAYAFAMGAFMLLWRFIVLVFLMIFSPIMFIGMIFPKAKKFQDRWWSTFLNAAFYAPAYMLMIYVAYAIAARINVFDDGEGMFYAVSGNYGSSDLILNFMIVIGFMWGAVMVGKEMSYHGSNATMNLANNIRRRGQRVLAAGTLGAGGGLLRATRGRNQYNTAEGTNKRGRKLHERARKGGINGWIAEQQLARARKNSESSYDLRQALGKSAQNELGSGTKTSYKKTADEYKKHKTALAESMGEDQTNTARVEVAQSAKVAAAQALVQKQKTKLQAELETLTDNKAQIEARLKASNSEEDKRKYASLLDSAVANIKTKEREHAAKLKPYENIAAAAQTAKKDAIAAAKVVRQTTYAENLQKPLFGDNLFGHGVDRVLGDKTKRTSASKAIKKKFTKQSNAEQIKKLLEDDITPPLAATPPPASSAGTAGTTT